MTKFVLTIDGDGPIVEVVDGLDGLRAALSREFWGPDGPQTDGQREEEAARWASVSDLSDRWEYAHDKPFMWAESGEDYAIQIYRVTSEVAPPARSVAQETEKELSVEKFRAEVRDKLYVVYHGAHSTPTTRSLHLKQCEDFLVERYAEALASQPFPARWCDPEYER